MGWLFRDGDEVRAGVMDGAALHTSGSKRFEIFDPPWWRVDRWARWLLSRRAKGRVTVACLLSGKPRSYRVWSSR
jgi:hypothetical protein